MENTIIIASIAVIVALGLWYVIRHPRSRGGCCGGGGYKPRRKRLARVICTGSFRVEGMHCKHCRDRVEETVNYIPGVSGRVDLRSGVLTVYYEKEIDDGIIVARLERLGYKVTK